MIAEDTDKQDESIGILWDLIMAFRRNIEEIVPNHLVTEIVPKACNALTFVITK